MANWEYKTALVQSDGDTRGLLDVARQLLDVNGETGWELVNVVPNTVTRTSVRQGQQVATHSTELLLFFKRPR